MNGERTMPTMTKVRLGFIGAEWWATANHMPLFQKRDDVEFAAVCRLGSIELEQVKERFGFRFATESAEELVRQPLDAVIVTSPHTLRFEHARLALERGLDVLCDAAYRSASSGQAEKA
jgi:predicted dehydrogenase